MKSHHEMEVEVAKIIKGADLAWEDDIDHKIRYIWSRNKREPLTLDEKYVLLKYFGLIEFPLQIAFLD